jgi:hypothetical protein
MSEAAEHSARDGQRLGVSLEAQGRQGSFDAPLGGAPANYLATQNLANRAGISLGFDRDPQNIVGAQRGVHEPTVWPRGVKRKREVP